MPDPIVVIAHIADFAMDAPPAQGLERRIRRLAAHFDFFLIWAGSEAIISVIP